jgi:predicted  nucleic acid-binding Zn-ribbon protein
MSNIRIKRRLTGNAGAPSSLLSGELAHNFVDEKLYLGSGSDIKVIAGRGEFVDKSTAQTISGKKTFSGGIDAGSLVLENVATPVSNSDAATKGYVDTAIQGVIDSAPDALNTLNELAAALNDDANFAASVTSLITANSTAISAIDVRLTSAESDISTLESEMDSVESRATSLEGRVSTAEDDIADIESAASTLEGRVSTAESDITALEGRASTLESDLSTAESNISTLQSDLDTAESNISTLQSDLDTAESNISTLQSDVSSAQSDLSDHESRIAALESSIDGGTF